MNMYNRFAYLYDELMDDFNYKDWFEYIEDTFKRYSKSPETILEMACGTGSLSYYLGRKGYKLTCFDISEEMLSLAYNKLMDLPNIELFNQNMIDFNFGQEYDSVISICDSINYITVEEDLLKVFKNVWNHLKDDGIFIFDINSYYKLEKVIGNNIFIEDREDIFYSWENYFDYENEIASFDLTFFVKEEEYYMRFDEEHRQRAYRVDRIVELLKRANFTRIEYYEAFNFNSIKDNTERINFIVRK